MATKRPRPEQQHYPPDRRTRADSASVAASASNGSDGDDEVGHLHLRVGDVLNDFEVKAELGKGTFGKVWLCWDPRTRNEVALKVVRSVKRYTEAAKVEADILEDVNRADPSGTGHVVRLHSSFTCGHNYVMVTDALGPSLYEYIKANSYRPAPLYCVQSFADQLITTMAFLHEMRLIHTDLKLENILCVSRSGWTVVNKPTSTRATGVHVLAPRSTAIKVIDFGGATYDWERKSHLINTRQYRAPEVVLNLGWSMPSDMWSVGCILMELYTGELLFQTHDNAEHLALMEMILGPLPSVLSRGNSKEVHKLFDRFGRQRFPETAVQHDSVKHVANAKRLEDMIHPRDTVFLDLVRQLLRYDPEERITAKAALNHRFFRVVRGEKPVPMPRYLPPAAPAELFAALGLPRPTPSRTGRGNGGGGGGGGLVDVDVVGPGKGARAAITTTSATALVPHIHAAGRFSSKAAASPSAGRRVLVEWGERVRDPALVDMYAEWDREPGTMAARSLGVRDDATSAGPMKWAATGGGASGAGEGGTSPPTHSVKRAPRSRRSGAASASLPSPRSEEEGVEERPYMLRLRADVGRRYQVQESSSPGAVHTGKRRHRSPLVEEAAVSDGGPGAGWDEDGGDDDAALEDVGGGGGGGRGVGVWPQGGRRGGGAAHAQGVIVVDTSSERESGRDNSVRRRVAARGRVEGGRDSTLVDAEDNTLESVGGHSRGVGSGGGSHGRRGSGGSGGGRPPGAMAKGGGGGGGGAGMRPPPAHARRRYDPGLRDGSLGEAEEDGEGEVGGRGGGITTTTLRTSLASSASPSPLPRARSRGSGGGTGGGVAPKSTAPPHTVVAVGTTRGGSPGHDRRSTKLAAEGELSGHHSPPHGAHVTPLSAASSVASSLAPLLTGLRVHGPFASPHPPTTEATGGPRAAAAAAAAMSGGGKATINGLLSPGGARTWAAVMAEAGSGEGGGAGRRDRTPHGHSAVSRRAALLGAPQSDALAASPVPPALAALTATASPPHVAVMLDGSTPTARSGGGGGEAPGPALLRLSSATAGNPQAHGVGPR